MCMYIYIYIYIYISDRGPQRPRSAGANAETRKMPDRLRGNHLPNTTRLTQVFFKSDEYYGNV